MKDISNIYMKSKVINIFSQKFGEIEFTIFVGKCKNMMGDRIFTKVYTNSAIIEINVNLVHIKIK